MTLDTDALAADAALVASAGEPLGRWSGVLATEGEWTGDDRMFEPDAIRWDTEAPSGMPLRWTPTDEGAHNGARHVGWIDTVAREGAEILGAGSYFDAEFGEFLARAGKSGVSVDLDDESYTVTLPEDALDVQPEAGGTYPALGEKKTFTDGRIRGATCVSLPAFITGYVELVSDEPEALVAATADGGSGGRTKRGPKKPKAVVKSEAQVKADKPKAVVKSEAEVKADKPKGDRAEQKNRSGGTQGGKAGRDGDSDGVLDEKAKSAEESSKSKPETKPKDDKPNLSKQERTKRLVEAVMEELDEVLALLSPKQRQQLLDQVENNAEAFVEGAMKSEASGGSGGGGGGGSKGGASKDSGGSETKSDSGSESDSGGKSEGGGGDAKPGRLAGFEGVLASVKSLLKTFGENMAPADSAKLEGAVDKLDSLTSSAVFAIEPEVGTTHAGVLLVAEDTGRWLMLQRALEEGDENGGKWEFPGGGLDDGESPIDGASREFAEEVGVPLPPSARLLGGLDSGIYRLHVLATPAEADIDIDGRVTENPDDPDGDRTEAVAWWGPEHVQSGADNIRSEVQNTDWDSVQSVIDHEAPAVTASAEFTSDGQRGPGDGPDGYDGRRLPNGRRGPAKKNRRNADGTEKAKGTSRRGPGRPRAKAEKNSTLAEWRKDAGDRLRSAIEHSEGAERDNFEAALNALQADDNAGAKRIAAKKVGGGDIDQGLDLGPIPTKASGEVSTFASEDFSDSFAEMFDISKMPKQLIAHWTTGEGGAKIGWGTPGDFDRCTREIDDYTGKLYAKGTCANLHKIATGKWPNQNSAEAESFDLNQEGPMAENTEGVAIPDDSVVDVPADDFMRALDILDEVAGSGTDGETAEKVAEARAILEEYVETDEPPEEPIAEVVVAGAEFASEEPAVEVPAAEDAPAELTEPDKEVLEGLRLYHEEILRKIEDSAGSELSPAVKEFVDGVRAAVESSDEQVSALLEPPVEFEVLEGDSLVASAAPVAPPDEWFQPFDLDGPTPLTITADGRVYGHLTTWDSCHRAAEFQKQGVCVRPPSDPDAPFFQLGQVLTASGNLVDVGTLTVGGGHADRRLGLVASLDHYDDVSTAGAAVRVVEDQYGVGLFGSLVADATPEAVAALRRAPLSGDWRKERGKWRLVAAHAVVVPGYPLPRDMSLVASGGDTDDMAFITTGRVERCGECTDSLVASVGQVEFEVPEAFRQMVSEVMDAETSALVASYAPEFELARAEIHSALLTEITKES